MPTCHFSLQTSAILRGISLLLLIFWLAINPAFASAGHGIDWWEMLMKLLGGLALFLYGMEKMADALGVLAGKRMKNILNKLTSNRFTGALTGAFVTAIIQSSSVTTVLVVGFISAGIMSMQQSIGVIMGANIGTTITAQIIAFKVTKAALLMIAVGFSLLFFSRKENVKQYGNVIMGLGLVFFGMDVMSDAMKPLRSFQPFLDLMVDMENPLIGILVAAGFTALVQSSSATTGIVIVMASQGFITLAAGIALAFGANIGTCVTALLAAIGKPREALRAAIVHVLFNVFGVLLWVAFIPHLAALVTAISPLAPYLEGTAKLAAEAPRQIANAHTLFNISNTLIFIGFVSPFARLVEWLVPDKPLQKEELLKPKYLDESLLETPALALDRARMEMQRISSRIHSMMEDIMPAVISSDRDRLQSIARKDEEVDSLHGHIITYLGLISQKHLDTALTNELLTLMKTVNDLENMGDLIETDLVELGNEHIKKDIRISKSTQNVLFELHRDVLNAMRLSFQAIAGEDMQAARQVIEMKALLNEVIENAIRHEAQRLVAQEPNRLQTYSLEIEMIDKLKRIYYFAKRIAKNTIALAPVAQQPPDAATAES